MVAILKSVSVLYREPKLLKSNVRAETITYRWVLVSVLYREPKLLKFELSRGFAEGFSTFQCSTVSRNC